MHNGPVTARFATAIHEASHAVCALSFGLPVKRLSLSADGLEGECLFRQSDAAAEQTAAVFLAGVLGQRLIAPQASLGIACIDIEAAGRYTEGLDLKTLVSKTRHRLWALWEEIVRVAETLDRLGSMSSDEIVRTARMPPLSWLN